MSAPLVDAWSYGKGDPCIVLFTRALEQWRFDIPEGGKVLELGCCESEWAATLKRCRPDVHITGIDVRPCPDYPGEFIQADAASIDWLARGAQFDWIVGISSIEHFGLGWSEYGDPKNDAGDMFALMRASEALKAGGHIYFDVPYTPQAAFQTEHWRCYDDDSFANKVAYPAGRLNVPGCVERARGFAPNERESELSLVRPLVPMSPFWFTARWLTKVA